MAYKDYQKETTKLKVGRYLISVTLIHESNRIFVQFRYNKNLIAEVKMMQGSKWHGFDKPTPKKIWSIANTPRNHFQLAYLKGENPYAQFDEEIGHLDYSRPLYSHQKELTDFILTRHYCIIAADCGLGKTLSAIEAAERIKPKEAWYVAPKSAIYAVQREMIKWDCKISFEMFTYQHLVKLMNQEDHDSIPQLIIFDESSRIKNPTAQRSQAALIAANLVREQWGVDGYVILMSGSPAPKSPLDWHHQSEVACPGFLREGTQAKFKQTLAITEKQENPFGGSYYQIISWRDDIKKCDVCGEFADHSNHRVSLDNEEIHTFKPSVNEVARLSKRLEGLVDVRFKKDCLDLPDKIYRQIELPPTQQMLQVARTILDTASTTIAGLTLLRELSDGFQYNDIADGFETCPVCHGSKRIENPLFQADIPESSRPDDFDNQEETTLCDGCGGKGHRKKFRRVSEEVECPKDSALRDLLDEYGEIGRVVIYGGFTGSIDRIIKICEACNWDWIRVDGRGWHSNLEGDFLTNFQDKVIEIPRLAFIGQPGAAGMGLTLTASPVIIYYSNDFNAESRIQSEERCHRPGMDLNLSCTIVDLLHLPPDQLVLENLKKKRRLQSLTLGKIKESFNDS